MRERQFAVKLQTMELEESIRHARHDQWVQSIRSVLWTAAGSGILISWSTAAFARGSSHDARTTAVQVLHLVLAFLAGMTAKTKFHVFSENNERRSQENVRVREDSKAPE